MACNMGRHVGRMARITDNPDDPAFIEDFSCCEVDIYLNGIINHYCVEADERLGYIKTFALDRSGSIMYGRNGEPIKQVLYGIVTIKG